MLNKHYAFILCFLLTLSLSARAQSTVPPEAKKVVEAFSGSWTLTGNYFEPKSKSPVRLTVTMTCEPALSNMAVICRTSSNDEDGGHLEIASIVSFSLDDNLIHLMEGNSAGSYHVHKGKWVKNVVRFERLTKHEAGKKIIEDFSIDFPAPNEIIIKSIEKTAQGTSTMELTGRRDSK